MTFARIYARFSTEAQNPLSIEDQFRVCREYAARQGWKIVSEHSDVAISGAALGNRPGAQEALKRLQAGEVLLLNDLERLARSQDLAPLIARLNFRRVKVIAVQSAFDSTSETASMQAGLSGLMSEQFRKQIARRTHSGLELRARMGKSTGGRAYDNADIVREVFRRWADGEGTRAIANDLNRRGVPSPGATWNRTARRRDGRWLNSTLHELLHNERYVGRLIWNRSQWMRDPDTGKRQRRERPQSEWVVQRCEPIIDEATWQRAQARFRASSVMQTRAPKHLLSGLLTCALCGAKMVVIGGKNRRYRCGTNHAGGDAACSNRDSFTKAVIEQAVMTPVLDQLLSPEAIDAGLREMRSASIAPVPSSEHNGEEEALQKLVRDGVLSADVARPAIEEARRKAARQRASQPVSLADRPTREQWRAAVAGIRTILTGEDLTAAREALHELIGTLSCRPAGDVMIVESQPLQAQAVVGCIPSGSGGRI